MRYRFFRPFAAMTSAASMLVLAGLASQPAVAQAPKAHSEAKTWVQPKTPWGDPDLQGTWTDDDCIGTPMNRPENLGDRGFYTEQELTDREDRLQKQLQ